MLVHANRIERQEAPGPDRFTGRTFPDLLCFGVVLATEPIPHAAAGAAVFLGLGSLGLGIVWARVRKAFATARALADREQRRDKARSRRKQRNVAERLQRQEEEAARARATERQAQHRAEAQRAEREAGLREQSLRHARTTRLEAAVDRLTRLSGATLQAEIQDLFARKGLEMRAAGSGDFLLYSHDNAIKAVARILPPTRVAAVSDIEQLETLRFERGAAESYLFSLRGFAEDCVRRIGALPVTLVEAHLLAHWQDTAEDQTV